MLLSPALCHPPPTRPFPPLTSFTPSRPPAASLQASKNLRRGVGKMRNRRYVARKGPLLVYGADAGVARAFRNLPGLEVGGRAGGRCAEGSWVVGGVGS